MNTKKVDMLKGSLWDKIVLFALPIAASSILQQLFNSADVAVVGRFAGTQAVAAVGSNSNVISLIINLFLGIFSWFKRNNRKSAWTGKQKEHSGCCPYFDCGGFTQRNSTCFYRLFYCQTNSYVDGNS